MFGARRFPMARGDVIASQGVIWGGVTKPTSSKYFNIIHVAFNIGEQEHISGVNIKFCVPLMSHQPEGCLPNPWTHRTSGICQFNLNLIYQIIIFLIQNCFTNRNNYLPTLLFYSFLVIYFQTNINVDFTKTLKGTFFYDSS